MPTRLYALGSNSSGQLGIGHHDDVDVPSACQFLISRPDHLVQPGEEATAAEGARTTTTAAAAAAATAPHRGENHRSIRIERTSDLPSPIRKIVAGGNHTLVLCDDGSVYAAGNRAALGEAVATDDGDGDMTTGTNGFRRVMWWDDDAEEGGGRWVDEFADVAATWSASFFVAVAPQMQDRGRTLRRYGRVYACGSGEKGELGLGRGVLHTACPRLVVAFGEDVERETAGESARSSLGEQSPQELDVSKMMVSGGFAGIWSGVSHTIACFEKGKQGYAILGWGTCRKGQLGDSVKNEKMIWEPRPVSEEDIKRRMTENGPVLAVTAAAVGRDFTLLQVMGERQTVRRGLLLGGNGFLNGDGEDTRDFLESGLKAFTSAEGETEISTRPAAFASWSNLFILDHSTSKVAGIGRNDHGQLPARMLPDIRTMAAGSEHCLGLTHDGTVLAWGWGEHGNCGRRSDKTAHDWNLLDLPTFPEHQVEGVAAGCATSFIWTSSG